MYGINNDRRFGFTLLELLVVLAIIVALVALLAPVVMTMQEKSNVRVAQSWIGNFNKALDAYAVDHGKYPTTEQGLNALIYIPLNEGQQQPGMMQQSGLTNPNDPNAATNMGAFGVGGAEAFNNPGAIPGMPSDPTSMGGGAVSVGGIGMTPGMAGTTNMMPGMTGDPNMMPGMTGDPNMMPGMTGDMNSMVGGNTGYGTGWTQPLFNPQLYINARKRLDPYLTGDKLESDPWKRPFRYEYYIVNGINPRTGDRRPAIWSAGPDGVDDTDDDIRSWDPQVAAQQRALQQQPMQPGGMGGVDAMGNPLQPGMMGGVDAMGNPLQPGMMDGMMQPGGGMQMQPPGGMQMQPGGVPPMQQM